MQEIKHSTLSYRGTAGEHVTISVTAEGTNQIANFTLDGGEPVDLVEGDSIEFDLSPVSGAQRVLQVNLDFTANGSYTITIDNVTNCSRDLQHENKCSRTRPGPEGITLDFTFTTV